MLSTFHTCVIHVVIRSLNHGPVAPTLVGSKKITHHHLKHDLTVGSLGPDDLFIYRYPDCVVVLEINLTLKVRPTMTSNSDDTVCVSLSPPIPS